MERKWPTTHSLWELKRHPTALMYDDVAPRHVPAETYQHSWAPHTQENKLISRDIYALKKTSKGYGRTWGIFSDGHSSARKSI